MIERYIHFLVFFSFNGYGRALSFKDLKDENIDTIEVYIREELPILLHSELHENGLNYDHKQKMCLFCPYASVPDKFKIPVGDRKTLLALAAYVKGIVDTPELNAGLSHFAKDGMISKKELSYERNLIKTVFGLVFGCTEEKRQIEISGNIPNMRDELFNKAKAIFNKFENEEKGEGFIALRKFTLNMVNVTLVEQKPKGIVKCVFCDENDLSGDVKVFWKTSCWALANLNAHIKRKHINITNENAPPNDEGSQLIAISIELNPDSTINSKSAESCEDAIYTQISAQCIKMANAVAKNKDKTQSKSFGIRKKAHSINFCTISPNGNCFFLAVVHQLLNIPNGTNDLEHEANKLRSETVAYIRDASNLSLFTHDLKNRIKCSKKDDNNQITNACIEFLDEKLSVSGVWAGMESLKAVSEMKKVNIVVINDDGTSNIPNRFNAQADKSILLLFSSKNGKSDQGNQNRIHYDSVTHIGKERIASMANELTEQEDRRAKFLKENADRSLIELS